jgi:hypothetical protein
MAVRIRDVCPRDIDVVVNPGWVLTWVGRTPLTPAKA